MPPADELKGLAWCSCRDVFRGAVAYRLRRSSLLLNVTQVLHNRQYASFNNWFGIARKIKKRLNIWFIHLCSPKPAQLCASGSELSFAPPAGSKTDIPKLASRCCDESFLVHRSSYKWRPDKIPDHSAFSRARFAGVIGPRLNTTHGSVVKQNLTA